MYPVTTLYMESLRRHDREFFVKADIDGVEYTNTSIVDFNIDNSLSTSGEFEIGTAIPSKLVITLRTKDTIPPNAKIVPYIALSLAGMRWKDGYTPWTEAEFPWTGGSTEWLPLGEFFVDTREQVSDLWTFVCYDKLMLANVAYVSSLSYPTTQKAVFDEICGRLDYAYDSSVVIDSSYQIQVGPSGFSAREVLAYIAGANSGSVFVDKSGLLKFKRFAAATPAVFDVSVSDYYRTKLTNPPKSYSRVVVTYDTEDDLTYEAGSGDEDNTLYVENPFATQDITNDLLDALNGFTYLPIAMDARGFPQLEHGDVIGFEQNESPTWNETITSWDDTEIPWNGLASYKTIMLQQILNFRGGLTLTIEAPSLSKQKSELPVQGQMTKLVNKLDKTAIKEAKKYYGVTITRTHGIIVEREDHFSKAIFNSDEFAMKVGDGLGGYTDAVYFDTAAKKYKFNGTLEAADGVFSGSLSAATGTFAGSLSAATGTFTGDLVAAGGTFSGDLSAAGGTFTGTLIGVDGEFSGKITASSGSIGGWEIKSDRLSGSGIIDGGEVRGTTIIGSEFRTSTSVYPRVEISSSSKLFSAYSSATEYISIHADYFGSPAFRYETPLVSAIINASGTDFFIGSSLSSGIQVSSGGDLKLLASLLNSSKLVRINSWNRFFSNGDGETLQNVIDDLKSRITWLEDNTFKKAVRVGSTIEFDSKYFIKVDSVSIA